MKYGCKDCTCAGKTMRDPGCTCKIHELSVSNKHFNYFQEKPIHLREPSVLDESKDSRYSSANLSLEKVHIRRLDKKRFLITKWNKKPNSTYSAL